MLKRKLAALDIRQEADGADQMFIDREVMIHVELHHRDHAPEFGDEVAENAGLVHAAEHAFGIARVGQKPQEKAVGGRIDAQTVVDKPQIGPHLTQHLGREGCLLLVGEREQADEIYRILGEDNLVDCIDAAVLDAEVRGAAKMGAALPAEGRQERAEARQRLELLHLERRADDAGQLADFLGDEKIMLHEALDGAKSGMTAITETLCHQLWTSKLRRSSGRSVRKWNWQRTDQRKLSQRRKLLYSAGVNTPASTNSSSAVSG